ncbi:hypothetical protein [Jannaschia sp. LMIT008]|uniref:hypothetical protein n=1 Tax=Jannaschia maritima TaxID=3032585 RepID=UPI0028127577|nr:hypothetical protein [Jannaschia sp. LMIT008]
MIRVVLRHLAHRRADRQRVVDDADTAIEVHGIGACDVVRLQAADAALAGRDARHLWRVESEVRRRLRLPCRQADASARRAEKA